MKGDETNVRVLVFTQHFWPEENAPAQRWTWFAEELAAQGIELDIITSSWRAEHQHETWPQGVHIHRVGNVVAGLGLIRRSINEALVSLKGIVMSLRVPRPDVIIVSSPPVGSMPLGHVLSWLRRRPLVLDLRDAWPELLDSWETWADYGEGQRFTGARAVVMRLIVGYTRTMMRWTRSRAKLLVTTSEAYAEQLRGQGEKNVVCIRNAPSAMPVSSPPLDDGVLKVLYLGNVGRAQYLATAVRAAARVREEGGRICLRIVGAGAHLHAVQGLARKLEAPVEFHPRVSRDETAAQYEWADTVLIMLRDWDALEVTVPSKLYDALAVGRHITMSAAGEAARIVTDSEAGDAVPPPDPEPLAQLWLELAEDRARLEKEPHLAWLREHTDPTELGRRYANALRRVAGQPSRAEAGA